MTNDYADFDALDFMRDPLFRDWVFGPSPEAAAFWETWLLEHPEKSEVVFQAKEWLLAVQSAFDGLPEHERLDRIDRIKQMQRERHTEPIVRRLAGWRWWSAAASVVLTIGLSWLAYATWFSPGSAKPQRLSYGQAVADMASAKPIERQNLAERLQVVTLPDGSTVTLSAGSKVSYLPTLATKEERTVYLSGEAFFDVVKDPKRPFLVYANGVVTKVLVL